MKRVATPAQKGTYQEELALLVEAVRDYAIFLLGPTGEIRSWNAGAERILGYDADEIVGDYFTRFYGPEDLEARKPQRELEVAEAEGRVEDEGWRLRKDGTRFWANTIITALRGESGELKGFAKVTRDLSARKEAEERLRQSEEVFRLLVSSVKDYAIFMLDPDGNVATWNEGAHRLKQYEPEEIIGRHFSTFYPQVDILARKPERELEIARAEGSVIDEGWRIRKDGTRFWAIVVITAVFDELGQLRGFAKVTRDATEKKRAEEVQETLLQQRQARLKAEEERRHVEASYRVAQEANRAKDEFLMTLSHELRTPMTSILGWARLLPTLSPEDEGFRAGIAAIGRSAELQATLIDDVLDVSRIMSGKLRLNVENVDMSQLFVASLDSVRPSADAKGVTVTSELDPAIGPIVGDPARLQQVIWNLLTNAVKFTPRGGLVRLSARATASHVQLTVSDTGEGIEPGFLPHIFEAFRQAEGPTTRTHGGLGLGLSIVRYIVEAHGGTISAESHGRGLGATFTVTLLTGVLRPTVAEPVSASERDVAAMPQLPRLPAMKILLVDDDREARQLVRAVLQYAGATVIAVESAALAMSALTKQQPDLVITDIAMPGMDGYALARDIRRRPEMAGLKLVALSAFPAGKVAATRSGFDEYLMKPIDPVALVQAVQRVMSA
jgi:PAS domain S-box-containing protein